MKQLALLACSAHSPAPELENMPASAIKAHWHGLDAPAGQYAIPRLLRSMLLRIREEHMRWAYDMGFAPACARGEGLAESLICGERPSMWWTSLIYERHPKLSPGLYVIYKLRCLELLIEETGVDSVALYGGDAQLRETLAEFCDKAGLEFAAKGSPHEEKPTKNTRAARIYGKIPAPLRAVLRLAHWWWRVRRKLPFCRRLETFPPLPDSPDYSRTATIATYFPNIDMPEAAKGSFRSNYWQSLHDALNREARHERPDGPHFVRWLFIRFPSPQLDFAQCLKLRDEFQKNGQDGFSYHYLEEFLTAADIFRSIGRWLKLWRASARAERKTKSFFHFKDSRINFWPWLREEWRESFQGWRCLERCLQNRAFCRYVEMAGRQRWFLFPLENCPWERMLSVAVHSGKANGPVIGAQHSTIRPTDFRYFDDPRTFASPAWTGMQPDTICGNGNSAITQWLANAMPADRLKQVEALRYLYLATPVMKSVANPANELPPEPGEPLEMPARLKLLVVTSFFADETGQHLSLLAKALESGLFSGWRITIKPHPYLTVESWVNALPAKWREQITMVDSPLALELRPGVAVWASNSTTAALEAALENLSLMVMWPHNDFDLCPIQDIPELLRTGTLEDTEYAVAHLRPARPGPDYLDLNPSLPAWRELLGLAPAAPE